MRLYRGTDTIIDNPIILELRRPLDFGDGFYLTTDFDHAKKWAIRVKNRNNSLKRLKVEKLCNQILFHTKKSLEFLKHIGAEEIR